VLDMDSGMSSVRFLVALWFAPSFVRAAQRRVRELCGDKTYRLRFSLSRVDATQDEQAGWKALI